jgi:hypothetical protein
VVSLVLGVCGGWLFGLVFGVVALVQIHRRPQRGKAMAIAGVVLSCVLPVVLVAGGLAIYVVSRDRADADRYVSADVAAAELVPGACINDFEAGPSGADPTYVACNVPHDAEVFARFDLVGGAYPGYDSVAAGTEHGCEERLSAYAPQLDRLDADQLARLGRYFYYPTGPSWRMGDRLVICMITNEAGRRSGSVRDLR